MVGWLVGWLAGRFVGWLVGWLIGQDLDAARREDAELVLDSRLLAEEGGPGSAATFGRDGRRALTKGPRLNPKVQWASGQVGKWAAVMYSWAAAMVDWDLGLGAGVLCFFLFVSVSVHLSDSHITEPLPRLDIAYFKSLTQSDILFCFLFLKSSNPSLQAVQYFVVLSFILCGSSHGLAA